MQVHDFGAVDYVVFVLTITVSLGIGIYYALSGGRQKTTSEYLVGNRKMAVLPVAISLLVSFESSIMMLGTPAEIYRYGIQWIWSNVGFFIANLLAVKVMVPLLHPLKLTSANEVNSHLWAPSKNTFCKTSMMLHITKLQKWDVIAIWNKPVDRNSCMRWIWYAVWIFRYS